MGAASSTENHAAKVQQFRQTVLEGKPLDASDIKVSRYLFSEIDTVCDVLLNNHSHLPCLCFKQDLDEAKEEIKKLRELATTALNENTNTKPRNDDKGKLLIKFQPRYSLLRCASSFF